MQFLRINGCDSHKKYTAPPKVFSTASGCVLEYLACRSHDVVLTGTRSMHLCTFPAFAVVVRVACERKQRRPMLLILAHRRSTCFAYSFSL